MQRRSLFAAFTLSAALIACSSTTEPVDAGNDVSGTDAPVSDAPTVDVPVSDTSVSDAPVTMDTSVIDVVAVDAARDVINDPVDADAVADATTDLAPFDGAACTGTSALDLLFVIDDSASMVDNQSRLAAQIDVLINALTRADATGGALRDLHVGVVSTDLGTPGVTVPSCANGDLGDDGLLNPVRYGLAMRAHQPWTTAAAGTRPARCTMDPTQYPSFLSFTAGAGDASVLRDDMVCNAVLGSGGCGIEQPIESAYRALVSRDPRVGSRDANAGFVRNGAVLGLFFVTDEEDGSTRDCRFAEPGYPCTDATSVFDFLATGWASPDLNLRFYLGTPGASNDPTWSLDRYMDPSRPLRGFTSLKPAHPELVVMGAIAGVPLSLPHASDGSTDWDALLGRNPDGSDGLQAMSAEGPVSMRQANRDPMCSSRVVPACRREASTPTTACDPAAQYFAWPSRRLAQLARRYEERYGNGVIGSICATSYADTMAAFAARVRRRLCAP